VRNDGDMTHEEYETKRHEDFETRQSEILEQLPEEFRATVSWEAYDAGHAYGYEEILIRLENIVGWLAPCCKNFAKRFES
jgi:hypothetical protein